jgi:hypothetical protein
MDDITEIAAIAIANAVCLCRRSTALRKIRSGGITERRGLDCDTGLSQRIGAAAVRGKQ